MKTSEKIDQLAAAMVALHAEARNLKPTATNKFLGNKFIPLSELSDYARPLLHKHGLAVIQFPAGYEAVGLTTIVMHESGQWIEETISYEVAPEKGKSIAQVMGSYITYLRRYALGAVLGVTSDEDIDAHVPAQEKPSESHHAPQEENYSEGNTQKTRETVKSISGILKALRERGVMDIEVVKRWWDRAMASTDDQEALDSILANLYRMRDEQIESSPV